MSSDTTVAVTLRVNGVEQTHEVEARTLLAPFLRDELGLTGTKISCDAQICGACTVLVDELPVSACTTLVLDTDGRSVTTVEGLAQNGELTPIQRAFMEQVAYQCGFCTSGQLMSATWVIEKHPEADRATIADLMHGNICRCGAYPAILAAIEGVINDAKSNGS